jgi:hypothetical protein
MQISGGARFLIICPVSFDEYIRDVVVAGLSLQAGE